MRKCRLYPAKIRCLLKYDKKIAYNETDIQKKRAVPVKWKRREHYAGII